MLEPEKITSISIHEYTCRNPEQTAKFVLGELMVARTHYNFTKMLLLGTLAGACIGFGCEISILAAHDTAGFLGFGASRILAGAVFSLGLMLVMITGGELFTGNILIAGSLLDGRVTWVKLCKNWLTVYFANCLGAMLLAWIVFHANGWQQNDLLVGTYALKLGIAKVNLTFIEAFTRGILCNWLVCLAIWMSSASKNIIGKIFSIFFPIMTFVALGYEHSIANMFFIPKAMLLATQSQLVTAANLLPEKLANLSAMGFIDNLVPVTLGNMVGALVFIALPQWLAFVRKQ